MYAKHAWVPGAALSVILMQTWAAADEVQNKFPKSWAELEMRQMDADGDGKITVTEHTTGAERLFAAMDQNQDGLVSTSEMDIYRRQHMGAHAPPDALTSSDRIKLIDADQDGQLSAQEHLSGSRELFTRMDADGDRALTFEELQAGYERLAEEVPQRKKLRLSEGPAITTDTLTGD